MIFNNSTLLTYSHKPIFFGDFGFNYIIEKNIQIKGLLLDLENSDGVSGIFSGLNDLLNITKKTEDIVVNGYSLGSGYLTNLNIPEGNWVRTAEYIADIKIQSSGNLYNVSGDFFTGLDSFKNVNLSTIKSISEDFKINLNRQNVYEYDHELSIDINPALNQNGASLLAKTIASGLIGKEVPFYLISGSGAFYNTYKNHSEVYDLINKTFKFTESFQKSIDADENADTYYQYQLDRDEKGITEVKEIINIIGLSQNKFDGAKIKLQQVSGECYSRCQSFYLNYDIGNLKTNPISQGFQVDRFNGEIQFESVYTNNKFFESGYNWEISSQIDAKATETLGNISLNIIGHGGTFTESKYQNAVYGYNQKKDILYNTIYNNYLNFINKNLYCEKQASAQLSLKDKSVSVSKANGSIDYSLTYTDKIVNSGSNYYEQTSNIETSYPVNLFDEYKISNKLIRQFHDQKSFLEEDITINRKYDKETVLDFFPDDIYNNYIVPANKIKRGAAISINPITRVAQFTTKLVSDT